MDCCGDCFCRRIRKESAAFLKKAVVRTDDGTRSRRAQANNEPRLDNREFGLKPWLTGSNLAGRWLLVDPTLAPFFELEMLDGVGEIDFRTLDSCLVEGAVKQRTRRPNERTSSQVLPIAGLLSDQHNRRRSRAFSEDRLRGSAI